MKPHLQTTVFTLLAAGKSQREVARITEIDRKTIRGLAQRLASEQSNSPGVATGPAAQIPPPRPPGPERQSTSACEPHRDFIAAQLQLRRNFTAVYQDLVDQYGFTASYNSVKRFAGSLLEHELAQFDRLEFARGEEMQTRAKWTPFEGWTMRGRVERVVLRGAEVYRAGEVLAQPGSGHDVRA